MEFDVIDINNVPHLVINIKTLSDYNEISNQFLNYPE